jgi:hypothetical protein
MKITRNKIPKILKTNCQSYKKFNKKLKHIPFTIRRNKKYNIHNKTPPKIKTMIGGQPFNYINSYKTQNQEDSFDKGQQEIFEVLRSLIPKFKINPYQTSDFKKGNNKLSTTLNITLPEGIILNKITSENGQLIKTLPFKKYTKETQINWDEDKMKLQKSTTTTYDYALSQARKIRKIFTGGVPPASAGVPPASAGVPPAEVSDESSDSDDSEEEDEDPSTSVSLMKKRRAFSTMARRTQPFTAAPQLGRRIRLKRGFQGFSSGITTPVVSADDPDTEGALPPEGPGSDIEPSTSLSPPTAPLPSNIINCSDGIINCYDELTQKYIFNLLDYTSSKYLFISKNNTLQLELNFSI